jgi:transposase
MYICALLREWHPMAGTIFRDIRILLWMWFYAIFLFVMTRHPVSGKGLWRELGVTYYRIISKSAS